MTWKGGIVFGSFVIESVVVSSLVVGSIVVGSVVVGFIFVRSFVIGSIVFGSIVVRFIVVVLVSIGSVVVMFKYGWIVDTYSSHWLPEPDKELAGDKLVAISNCPQAPFVAHRPHTNCPFAKLEGQ